MSNPTTFLVSVYSPRWGHEDQYTITLSMEQMEIEHTPRKALCKWVEGGDPIWESSVGSLFDHLLNDHVHAPKDFLRCLEYPWLDWRSGELADEEVEKVMTELFDWLNATTRAKPKSEYWKGKI